MSMFDVLDAWEALEETTGILAYSASQGAAWTFMDAEDLAADPAQHRKLRAWIATVEADLAAWDDAKRQARRLLRGELTRLHIVLDKGQSRRARPASARS